MPLFYWNQAVRKSVYERELLHRHKTLVWMFWGQLRVLWRLFHCRRAPPISKGFGRSDCREIFPWQGELVGIGDCVPALLRYWHCHRTLLKRLAAYQECIWRFSFLGAWHRCEYVAGLKKHCDLNVRDISGFVVSMGRITWELKSM